MRWLLRLLVGEADRRAIESDLSELHDFRRRRDGADAADRWLRRQRRLYPWHRAPRPRACRPSRMDHDAASLARPPLHLRGLAAVPALSATIVLTVGVGLGATVATIASPRRCSSIRCPTRIGTPGLDLHRQPALPIPLLGRRLSGARSRPSDVQRRRGLSATCRSRWPDGDAAERVAAKAVTGSYFPLLGQRPQIGRLFDRLRRCPRRADRRPDLCLLGPALWSRSGGAGPPMTIDGARAHDGRRAAANVRSARARHRRLLAGALAGADAEGAVLHDGPRPPGSRRVATAAARSRLHATNARLFPIWRSSYQDEKATWGLMDLKTRVVGEVGSTLMSCWPPWRACCSSPAPTPSTC